LLDFSSMRLHSQIRRNRRQGEQGYVLLILLLMVAAMAFTVGIILPSITFEIKRDREEEMIHRGVQYSRAIRAYYKKFGRYPAKLEDLENTNQLRFLRKRYKDPLTGKDFKLLHYGEAKLSLNGIAGGTIAGATPVSGLSSSDGLGQASSLGQTSSFGQTSSLGGNSGGFGGSSNSLFGQNSQSTGNPTTGTNPSQTGASPDSSTDSTGSNVSGPNGGAGDSGNGTSAANTQFGGAPIVGVASISKDSTIREYDHKKKYNQWQFVYDPTFDQGFLITTPYQPSIQMFGQQQQNLNGQNNTGPNGQNGNSSGFGNSFGNSSGNSFGNSFGNSGMQNNPSPAGGGYNNTNQPQSPPPQSPPQQQ
jgi:hypothetical protein